MAAREGESCKYLRGTAIRSVAQVRPVLTADGVIPRPRYPRWMSTDLRHLACSQMTTPIAVT